MFQNSREQHECHGFDRDYLVSIVPFSSTAVCAKKADHKHITHFMSMANNNKSRRESKRNTNKAGSTDSMFQNSVS